MAPKDASSLESEERRNSFENCNANLRKQVLEREVHDGSKAEFRTL